VKNEIILLRIRNKSYDYLKKKEKVINIQDLKESFSSISESGDTNENLTLIVSHSRSDDLGIIFPRLCDLAAMLKCDVISYDYAGYGCSSNQPNYDSLKTDIMIVLNYCTNTFDLKKENIVLFSFNIGAIPSIYASIQPNYCDIRGMILISPKLDFIKQYNFENIKDVICPVFLIRADNNDEEKKKKIIDFAHTFKESIYWIPQNGHTFEEIMDENRDKFFTKIRKFLSHVQSTRMKIPLNIIESRRNSINSRNNK
jgi:alpha/beta superfamily hydrolase